MFLQFWFTSKSFKILTNSPIYSSIRSAQLDCTSAWTVGLVWARTTWRDTARGRTMWFSFTSREQKSQLKKSRRRLQRRFGQIGAKNSTLLNFISLIKEGLVACFWKVSRLAINMEGGFQTNKEAEYEEEVAIVLLPSMQKIEVHKFVDAENWGTQVFWCRK